MNKAKLTVGKYSDRKKTNQASSSCATGRRRIDMKLVPNVLLMWLDNSIDNNNTDCRNTISQLRSTVNTVNTFTDSNECVDFLTDIDGENICLVISSAFCRNVVPLIHDVTELRTILIFCENKTQHEHWAKEWPKIKGVFTEISPVCEALSQAAQQCEQNDVPISFLNTSNNVPNKNLYQLDSSFMYTQILKEILLITKFNQTHIKEFSDHCRQQFAGNDRELRNIKKLERKYHGETPIWWYMCERFLYSMLNYTLRLMDVGIIMKIGFFIDDLHRHIERLYKEQFAGQKSTECFTVYRGQGTAKKDFEQLTKTKGELISFNNFLSTSKTRDVSLFFAERNSDNPDLVGVLFFMTIDPSLSSTPFASIDSISQFQIEDEVLFAMHTVFRIDEIKPMDENQRLFQVELTLTSDNDHDLRRLTDHIREETFPDSRGWYQLGLVLLKTGQPEKAQEIYKTLLEQTTDKSHKATIYGARALAKCCQGEYQEAIRFFEKDLEISHIIRPLNHPELAKSYNNIGAVYQNMGEYAEALSSYEKALAIQQQSLPLNHPSLAASYNNIALVHENASNYSKVLSFYQHAVHIGQQSLPCNHPHLQMHRKHLDRIEKNYY